MSWGVLGHLGESKGVLEASWARLGGVLGGGLEEPLGGLGDVLGASCGVRGAF